MAIEKHQTVSLGCGTLILIALIVLIFGSGPSKKQLDQISHELAELRQAVSEQTEELRALRETVEQWTPPPPVNPSEEGSEAE